MTTIFKKFATGTAALALMTTVFASGAMAAESDGGDAKAEIQAGNFDLTINSPNAFALNGSTAFKLDGQTQNAETTMGFVIVNDKSDGAAWEVTVSAGPFQMKEDDIVKHTLPSEALTFLQTETESIAKGPGASEETITSLVTNVEGVSGKSYSAAAGTGMGTFTVEKIGMNLNLQPKDVYAGNYESKVTVSLVSAE